MGQGISSAKFGLLKFSFDADDRSTIAYSQRSWHEEYVSEFYNHVASTLAPDLLVDVGANYGVASGFMKMAMPEVPVVCVEPNPELLPYIQRNLSANNIEGFEVVPAVVGDTEVSCVDFHLNPAGSQDSRVLSAGANWTRVVCRQVTLTGLIRDRHAKRVFVKIDSQGFEEAIFRGADNFLMSSNKWLIKTEFAPQWIFSQGGDPERLLRKLCSDFHVTEYPSRYNYFSRYDALLRQNPIMESQVEDYILYVTNLAAHERGWVDLLVSPKQKL